MDWLNSYFDWRIEQGQWRFLFDLIFLIPSLLLFHYLMYHTKLHYTHIRKIVEWLPILIVLGLLLGVTFYYS